MELLSFAQAAVPVALREQVQELEDAAWPADRVPPTLRWLPHDPALDPVIVLLVDAGQLLASLAVLRTQLQHAGLRFAVGGISSVTTRTEARRRGHARRLVGAAHELMARSDLDAGLFTCDRSLRDFYQRAGWQLLPGAVVVGGTPLTPFRSDQPGFDKVTMADFFSAHGRAHRDRFRDTDIELYPGEIDRLW